MSNYNEATYKALSGITPVDTESVSTAAPAIRQIKQVLKNDTSNGYNQWLLSESKNFKEGLLSIFKEFIEALYPVGSYYITGNPNIDPNNFFGFGVWYQIQSDGYLFCVGANKKEDFARVMYNEGFTYDVSLSGSKNFKYTTGTVKSGSSTAQNVITSLTPVYDPATKEYFNVSETDTSVASFPIMSCCYVWYRGE